MTRTWFLPVGVDRVLMRRVAVVVGDPDVAVVRQERVEFPRIAPAGRRAVAVAAFLEVDPANPAGREQTRSAAQGRQFATFDGRAYFQGETPTDKPWASQSLAASDSRQSFLERCQVPSRAQRVPKSFAFRCGNSATRPTRQSLNDAVPSRRRNLDWAARNRVGYCVSSGGRIG